MPGLLHELIYARAGRTPDAVALRLRDAALDYATLADLIQRFAAACAGRGLEAAGRVAVWLPKRFETVAAIFGACAAGGAFVPVNPLLKPEQVGYILNDCNVRILVTDRERFEHMWLIKKSHVILSAIEMVVLFTMLVIVAVLTTLMAGPIFEWVYGRHRSPDDAAANDAQPSTGSA